MPGAATRRTLAGREALRYRKVDLDFLPGGRKAFKNWFSQDFMTELSGHNVMEHWLEELARLGDDSEGLMKSDWTTYLSENCLVKTDRSTMASGLEGRVPFLGNSIIDFAETMTAETNFSNGLKSLPTSLAARHLPSSVWDRPKHGFTVPVAQLFRTTWADLVHEMSDKIETLAPFLDAPKGRKLLIDSVSGSSVNRALAYSLLVYLIWVDSKSINAFGGRY